MRSKILFSLILLAALCSSAGAWEITKELQDEVNLKLASVEAAPNDPYTRFDLAITYAYTNKIQEGWEELKKVNELNKKFAPAALEMYTKQVQKTPNDWKLRFRLAFALYFNEKKMDAIKEMEYISNMEPKEDPKRIWAYAYMSLIYGEEDKVSIAIDYAKKALKIDSNVAAIHMLLASGYSKKGKSWEAFWEGMEALRLKALGY
jgi:tetratricopeptide (TPR) repeat protein